MKENRRVIFNSDPNNKLQNRVFVFIRKSDPDRFIKGKFLDVFTKRQDQEQLYAFKGLIIFVETYTLQDLPEHYIYLDTGYSKKKTIEIIEKSWSKFGSADSTALETRFDIVILSRYYERPTENGHDQNQSVSINTDLEPGSELIRQDLEPDPTAQTDENGDPLPF